MKKVSFESVGQFLFRQLILHLRM